MNKKINIIIIDSGAKKTDENIIGYGFSEIGRSEDFEDEYGHGTAIYSIIKKVNDFSDIINIKLNNIDDGVDSFLLEELLKYIYQNEKADIINLSLGVDICDNFISLQAIVDKIASSGTIIVSAFDNSGSISYPAAFDSVIGVTTGYYCNKIDDFEYIDDNIVNVAAKGNVQRVSWTKPDAIMIGGSSFACAHTTVQIAKFMYGGIKTRKDILNKFKEISKKQHITKKQICSNNLMFKINRAAIFPFNKEMHSLVRYSYLLPFTIKNIYDVKFSATVGATTSHLLKDNLVQDILVKNIRDIEWNNFDTLILGHTEELSSLINKEDLKCELINEALRRNKKIYSFDEINQYVNNNNVYFPYVNDNNLPPNRFGMLYRISKPVVGVFGTSSRQGKFTVQLKLRQLLIALGYDVGQIGTEPSSLLYGMDYVFPMGYNSSVHIKEFDTVRYLNYIINDLCIRQKDIILVGSQSGTVVYDTGNIVQYNIPQYNFLIGTQPDAVILCVNPYDEVEYIHRTIRFIESCVNNCKVIAIVVFPMDINDNWAGIYGAKKPLSEQKYLQIKANLDNHFNLPIFRLGVEKDMENLTQCILNYF